MGGVACRSSAIIISGLDEVIFSDIDCGARAGGLPGFFLGPGTFREDVELSLEALLVEV